VLQFETACCNSILLRSLPCCKLQ